MYSKEIVFDILRFHIIQKRKIGCMIVFIITEISNRESEFVSRWYQTRRTRLQNLYSLHLCRLIEIFVEKSETKLNTYQQKCRTPTHWVFLKNRQEYSAGFYDEFLQIFRVKKLMKSKYHIEDDVTTLAEK